MKISANCSRGVLYITLCGELDEHSARQTRMEADKLAEKYAHANRALFDLKGVSFMDSTGIGFLIGRYNTFQRLGVPAYISNPTQETDKILSMSGVYTLMPRV